MPEGERCSVLAALGVAAHHAIVHDHVQTRRARPRGGVLIDDAVLEPDRARLDRDGVVDDRSHELRPPKDLDDVDGLRDLPQARIGTLTQHFVHIGIDRDDAVARALQVASDAVARTARVGAQADDGNRPGRRQDLFRDIPHLVVHAINCTFGNSATLT